MNPSTTLIALVVSYVCLLAIAPSHAADVTRHRRNIDRETAAEVLEMLLNDLQAESQPGKRNVDMGYGSRYGVAQSVGSKLLAVKYAADWNSPGRKRGGSYVLQANPIDVYLNSLLTSIRQ